MKSIVLMICFLLMTISLLADPSNPHAKRGLFTILSSEYGENVVLKKYPVSNLIDGNPSTAWVFEKAYSDFKDFKGLLICMDSEEEIDGISIINGYAKSDSLYKQNNTVSNFEIIFPDQSKYNYSCNETLDFQNFQFSKRKVKWLIIKVISERKGTKYNDLCISEISPTINNNKVIYKQPSYIISNNGGEYQSDVILNSSNSKKFDTDNFNYVCGAQFDIYLNDSTLIYSDHCEDSSIITILNLKNFTFKTIKNKSLNNYDLVYANSKFKFILKEKDKDEFCEFNTILNSIKPIKYRIQIKDFYWRWSERIYKNISNTYPALLH